MKKNEGKSRFSLFDYDGSFYTYTGKIFDLFMISIFWLVGCLPVITVGASTSAMYHTVVRSVLQDKGDASKVFWKSYKENMKNGIFAWLIYGGALFVLLLNIGIIRKLMSGNVSIFFLVLYALLTAVLVMGLQYAFPIVSRFVMPAGWCLKLSLYCIFRYFPASILLLIIFAAEYVLLLYVPGLLICIPAVCTIISSFILEPILKKHSPEEEGYETSAD